MPGQALRGGTARAAQAMALPSGSSQSDSGGQVNTQEPLGNTQEGQKQGRGWQAVAPCGQYVSAIGSQEVCQEFQERLWGDQR